MTEQEIKDLQDKYAKILSDCQTKLNTISNIAINATSKENDINLLNTRISELKGHAESGHGSITSLLQEVQNTKSQIDGHLQKISETVGTVTSKQQELDNHYNSFLAKPSEREFSKLEKINSTYQKIIEDGENSDKISSKLKEYNTALFGNSDTKTPGLKTTIENYELEIKNKKAEWENSYKALIEKIEGLLPGATSIGLAKAYQDQGRKYRIPYWLWSTIFILMTSGMIVFAIYSLHDSTSIADAFIKIISRIPFFVPAIWLAVFSSKQQSQSRRLQEEYAYKETLAKSYEGYKREIEKLPASTEKNKMLEKLLGTIVNMAEYNPSQTLQMRHHNDRPPILSDLFRKSSKPEFKMDKE